MKKRYIISLITLLFIICCTLGTAAAKSIFSDHNKELKNSRVSEKSTVYDEKETEAATELIEYTTSIIQTETDFQSTETDIAEVDKNLYGKWIVKNVAFANKYKVLESDKPLIYETDYIGTVFEYQKDFYKIGNKTYYNPIYVTEENTHWSYFLKWGLEGYYNYPLKNSKKTLVNGDKDGEIWGHLGNVIYLIDENHLLIEGCYLSMMAEKVTDEELKTMPAPKLQGMQDPTYLYGKWEIIDTSNNTSSKSKKYLHTTFEYQKDYCIFNEKKYYNPQYFCSVIFDKSSYDLYMLELKAMLDKYKTKLDTYYIGQCILFEDEDVYEIGRFPEYYNENYMGLWSNEDDNFLLLFAKRVE